MVFTSIPAYLDPSNWQQQQQTHHQIIGSNSTNPLHPPPPPQPGLPPPPQPHGAGSIRPGSMAERARMANIQMPEASLKCPRCESTNTKFCYFNNYSLSQPRHFCKTCRRYWTRGGALRNVPVGGGCRRNKKSKSSRSKSPASGDRQSNHNSTTAPLSANGGTGSNLLGINQPQLPPLRFVSPLTHLSDNFNSDIGLNYSGISAPPGIGTNEMPFHVSSGLLSGGGGIGGMATLLSGSCGGGGIESWRLQQIQQFPFLSGNLEQSPSGMYQFHQGDGESGPVPFILGGETSNHQMRPKLPSSLSQMASVKMENNPELNMSRQLAAAGGMPGNDQHQWNTTTGAGWTDLSSFSSSSTSNPL